MSDLLMSMARSIRRSTILLLLPAVAGAQVFTVGPDDEKPPPGRRHSPVTGGIAGVYGQPTGVFRDFVKQGVGLDGNVHWKVDRAGVFSLGLEGGFLTYGRETNRVPLSSTIGGRILVDVTTSNNIGWLGIGPQLAFPRGPIRPYASATAGFAYFWTQSEARGTRSDVSFASTTNYDDATWAWTTGGGVLIPVGRSGGAIDIGLRYHANGDVRYLRRGSWSEDTNGNVTFYPVQSAAPLYSWRIGFRGGLF